MCFASWNKWLICYLGIYFKQTSGSPYDDVIRFAIDTVSIYKRKYKFLFMEVKSNRFVARFSYFERLYLVIKVTQNVDSQMNIKGKTFNSVVSSMSVDYLALTGARSSSHSSDDERLRK